MSSPCLNQKIFDFGQGKIDSASLRIWAPKIDYPPPRKILGFLGNYKGLRKPFAIKTVGGAAVLRERLSWLSYGWWSFNVTFVKPVLGYNFVGLPPFARHCPGFCPLGLCIGLKGNVCPPIPASNRGIFINFVSEDGVFIGGNNLLPKFFNLGE